MKYYLKAMEKEVIIDNSLSEIVHITNFIKELGNSLQLSSDTVMRMSLALEEAIVNVITHAYPSGGTHEIRLKLNVASDELVFVLIDDGVHSNLASVEDLWKQVSKEENFLDNLGIHLIRQIMDEVSYQYSNGHNRLTMKKKMNIEIKTEETMRTNVCKIEGVTIITIDGRLDTINSQAFETIIRPSMESQNPNILLNCENLSYISSSGIRSFILLQKNVIKHNGQLILEAMKPEIKSIFDMTGCASLFVIR